MIIGLDFDNTIVGYDDLILRAAVSRGLVPAGQRANKKEVRDRIRELPDGEIEWQKVQALVYGPMMPEARMFEGVEPFVRGRYKAGSVFAVSHKTEVPPARQYVCATPRWLDEAARIFRIALACARAGDLRGHARRKTAAHSRAQVHVVCRRPRGSAARTRFSWRRDAGVVRAGIAAGSQR